jgi:hypothetical protein
VIRIAPLHIPLADVTCPALADRGQQPSADPYHRTTLRRNLHALLDAAVAAGVLSLALRTYGDSLDADVIVWVETRRTCRNRLRCELHEEHIWIHDHRGPLFAIERPAIGASP